MNRFFFAFLCANTANANSQPHQVLGGGACMNTNKNIKGLYFLKFVLKWTVWDNYFHKSALLFISRRHTLGAEQDISGDGRCEGVLPAVRHLPARHQDHARHCALDFLKYCVQSEVRGTLVWRPLLTANNSQDKNFTQQCVKWHNLDGTIIFSDNMDEWPREESGLEHGGEEVK